MPLRDRLAAQIRASGPLTIPQYVGACLHDPQDGYYATRPALGPEGDFITAPLVSQMFGELIGLWAVEAWVRLGRPPRVILAEMGPGDGTLMSDILRAARLAPDFVAAAEVWLVEVSSPLRDLQRARLGDGPRWAEALDDLPADAPLVLVANELLDCLPARQFVRTASGWSERVVGLDDAGALAFGLGARVPEGLAPRDADPGTVFELASSQQALGTALGRRIAGQGGAALLIDYGRAGPGFGDTLQALRRHQKVDPLEAPGEADLTMHADFPAVLAGASAEGAATAAILTQAQLLGRLGIEARAEALARARPEKAEVIGRQFDRLVSETQMGALFKACCIHSASLVPPGFEEHP